MTSPLIGVIVVSYNASDVIVDCIESLISAGSDRIKVLVVDNASTDNTTTVIEDWASGSSDHGVSSDLPFELGPVSTPVKLEEASQIKSPLNPKAVTLLRAPENTGFAGGVNAGLQFLRQFDEIGYFWILNPDSATPPASLQALIAFLDKTKCEGLIGGRVNYLEQPEKIQIDGGSVNFKTGVSNNFNLGQDHRTSPEPDPKTLDFITGASMIVSRSFLETVGLMREDYFLYYEEVDWALRRGDFPLHYCSDLLIYHRAGTAIGSPTTSRIASPFSLYFKHRGRMRFMWRFSKKYLPIAYAYSIALIGRMLLKGYWKEAQATFYAVHGLKAPKHVADRLSDSAKKFAFAKATS